MAAALNTARNQDSRYLSAPEDILRALKILRDQRCLLSLRFDSVEDNFSANVLDINDKYLILEDIRPRNGLQYAREARRFTLSARARGIYVYVTDCAVESIESERGVPYFLLSLPKRMLYQERRQSANYRVPLAVKATGATIRLHLAEESVTGEIIDISSGGCRARFRDKPAPVFNIDKITSSDIDIPHLLELGAKAIVRHQHRENDCLICGIEFSKMMVSDRRRLEEFVQKIAKSAHKAVPTTTSVASVFTPK